MENDYYKRYEPFFGEWHIKRFLGAGSYGRVFEIERRDAFDTVYAGALKAITIPSSPSELEEVLADGMDMNGASTYFRDYVKELNREIALMSKLKGHSNIVSYEDHKMFQHEDGVGWDILIRMELLTPITSLLRENRTFPRRKVIQLGIDLCRALEICQRYNIIHRDIKPANIFLSDTEDFKLGDFGVARIASAATGASTRAGTVNYMAPEVFRGEKYSSNVDLYSLGLVMYQLLNNNRMPLYPPYPQAITPSSRERAQARRLAGAALPAPVNAGGRLAEIVLKACAPDPAQRYDSPTVMRQALEAIRYDEREAADIYPEGDSLPVPGTDGSSLTGTAPSAPAAETTERLLDATPAAEATERLTDAAPAAEATERLMDAAPAAEATERLLDAAPAAEVTERLLDATPAAEPQAAAKPLPGQTAAQGDRTTFLFESQAEKRRQEQEAAEAARRKAAEEQEAELARIRAEKRAAQQAEEAARRAQEEAARKAQEEAARKAAAEQAEQPKPAAPAKKNGKLPLVIGGVVVAAVVAVGGFALAGQGSTSDSAADALYKAGTYTATAENDIGSVVVEMTFSADAITDVNIDASAQTKGIGQEAAQPMKEAILKAQSADVDGYTGATLTSDAIKQAAADCIVQASTGKAASGSASSLSQKDAEPIGSGSCGDQATWELYQDGTLYIKGSGAIDDSSELCTYDSYPPQWDFSDPSSVQKVVISDGITRIGSGFFAGCPATEVVLPDSVTEIGEGAFYGCESLESVTIPDGVTKIGDTVFAQCYALKSVTIPDSVTEIGGAAFFHCHALKSVTIPDGVTKIGDAVFANCESLESVTIPDSVTEIGVAAFSDCYVLKSVTIPNIVTEIGDGAFSRCPVLESVTIPDGVTEIGDGAFSECDALESVTIPDSVTKIGAAAFRWCPVLKSVTIPDSVTEIGDRAFSDCESLESVTISRNCTVGQDAFESGVQINYYN